MDEEKYQDGIQELINDIPLKSIRVGHHEVSLFVLDPRQPWTQVEIFIRNQIDQREQYRSGPLLVPNFEKFIADVKALSSSYKPTPPRVRTRTLDPEILQPYSNKYIQAYELMGNGQALVKFRGQLQREYTAEHVPIIREKSVKGRNFRDALDDALDSYRAEQTKKRREV